MSDTLPPGAADKCIQWTNGQVVRRMTLYLPPEVALEIKAKCARLDRKLSDAVLDPLCAWTGQDADSYRY